MSIIGPSPATRCRRNESTVPLTAPTPIAESMKPKLAAPISSSSAMSGIRKMYDMAKNVVVYVTSMSAAKSRSRTMNATPSNSSRTIALRGPVTARSTRSASSTTTMTPKQAAEAANTNAVPNSAMAIPAMAGETMRVACHITELSATALIICSSSMSCGKNALRTGQSTP